jgi:alpha-beta hydrolase superfamily lysophospholipase
MTQVARIAANYNSVAYAVYQAWAAQGMTVIAHDAQGHGRSKGEDPKLHVWMDNFDHWVNDIYQVRKVNNCFIMNSMFWFADIDSVNMCMLL